LEQVEEELEKALGDIRDINFITFSGNGEPTLHPQFPEIVEVVRRIRDRRCPQVKLAILSNSSMVSDGKVQQALGLLDVRILKLDAGTEKVFRRINRPCPSISFEEIVRGLQRMEDVILQTVLVTGLISNSNNRELSDWMERVAEIRPREVQIYSTDRPPAEGDQVQRVDRERLEQIAQEATRRTGVLVRAYGPRLRGQRKRGR